MTETDHQTGPRSFNGHNARAILWIVHDWIERSGTTADPRELDRELREAGYGPIPKPPPRTRPSRAGQEDADVLGSRLALMLEQCAAGWTPEVIGRAHGLTKGTVATYLHDARKRLGADTLEGAIAEAARLGLIDLRVEHPKRH